MAASRREPGFTRRKGVVIGLTVLLAACLGWFVWPRSTPVVDRDGYELAIALYQVCNQRTETRLDDMEARLAALEKGGSTNAKGVAELRRILQLAKSNHWDDAMQATRMILVQQVHRRADSR